MAMFLLEKKPRWKVGEPQSSSMGTWHPFVWCPTKVTHSKAWIPAAELIGRGFSGDHKRKDNGGTGKSARGESKGGDAAGPPTVAVVGWAHSSGYGPHVAAAHSPRPRDDRDRRSSHVTTALPPSCGPRVTSASPQTNKNQSPQHCAEKRTWIVLGSALERRGSSCTKFKAPTQ
ncbi:hypothetical protein OPV22_027682 [Ensete ventricosum]|uniref:Uncharacterized protein n=1 Tax=Ensete ventricosum TaxID=4639 RepID=A0AAV8Q0J2_ENSVE|nr:hypothetical protein OPV22_027682 [Ensete ventricosum]